MERQQFWINWTTTKRHWEVGITASIEICTSATNTAMCAPYQSPRRALAVAVKGGLVVDVNTGLGRSRYVWHLNVWYVCITTHVYSYVWHTLLTGEGNGAAPCSRRGQVELHTRSRARRIIRIRKDTIGGGGVLEIIALGSSLRALRCGKGGKAAGQDCHSSKERGKERLSPLATNQPYLPTICHRDFFSKSSHRTPRFGRR